MLCFFELFYVGETFSRREPVAHQCGFGVSCRHRFNGILQYGGQHILAGGVPISQAFDMRCDFLALPLLISVLNLLDVAILLLVLGPVGLLVRGGTVPDLFASAALERSILLAT